MTNLKDLYDQLCEIKTEERKLLILKLMKEGKISYQDITDCYVAWLQHMKEHISDEYHDLKGRLISIWADKDNRMSNIKDAMHDLLDKGQLNATHEQIEKKE